MNKNCIYFNIMAKIEQHSILYYSMLYQALESLQPFYDGSIDIIVFYDFDFDIKQFKYNYKYSLLEFDFVKFIKSDYANKYNLQITLPRTHDTYISKWYNLQNLFLSGYDNIFFTDCDILFYNNPSYIFNKYNTKDNIFGLGCFDKVFAILYPDIEPFLSGQILIHRSAIDNWSNFYDLIINERINQNEKAENLFNRNHISIEEKQSFQYFNEQYAPFMHLRKYKEFKHLEPEDYKVIDWRTLEGINDYFSIDINNNNVILSSIRSTILHYCGSANSFMTKEYLRNQNQKDQNDEWVKILENKKREMGAK